MNHTIEERVAVIRAYLDSGKTQAEFCEECGNLSPRTLRSWLQAHTQPDDALEHARDVVGRAVAELQAVLQGLEAAASCREAEPECEDEEVAAAAAACQEADNGDHEQFVDEDDAVHEGSDQEDGDTQGSEEPPTQEPAPPQPKRVVKRSAVWDDLVPETPLAAGPAAAASRPAEPRVIPRRPSPPPQVPLRLPIPTRQPAIWQR